MNSDCSASPAMSVFEPLRTPPVHDFIGCVVAVQGVWCRASVSVRGRCKFLSTQSRGPLALLRCYDWAQRVIWMQWRVGNGGRMNQSDRVCQTFCNSRIGTSCITRVSQLLTRAVTSSSTWDPALLTLPLLIAKEAQHACGTCPSTGMYLPLRPFDPRRPCSSPWRSNHPILPPTRVMPHTSTRHASLPLLRIQPLFPSSRPWNLTTCMHPISHYLHTGLRGLTEQQAAGSKCPTTHS